MFKSEILSRDEYVQVASDMYDEDYPEGGFPPYITKNLCRTTLKTDGIMF